MVYLEDPWLGYRRRWKRDFDLRHALRISVHDAGPRSESALYLLDDRSLAKEPLHSQPTLAQPRVTVDAHGPERGQMRQLLHRQTIEVIVAQVQGLHSR